MPIYNKLKDMRCDLRMDQTEFAKHLGVNKNLYNKWENQNGQPSLEWCCRISRTLGKCIEEFIVYEPDES